MKREPIDWPELIGCLFVGLVALSPFIYWALFHKS